MSVPSPRCPPSTGRGEIFDETGELPTTGITGSSTDRISSTADPCQPLPRLRPRQVGPEPQPRCGQRVPPDSQPMGPAQPVGQALRRSAGLPPTKRWSGWISKPRAGCTVISGQPHQQVHRAGRCASFIPQTGSSAWPGRSCPRSRGPAMRTIRSRPSGSLPVSLPTMPASSWWWPGTSSTRSSPIAA